MRLVDADKVIKRLKTKRASNDMERVMLAECIAEINAAPTKQQEQVTGKLDLISRQAAIDAIEKHLIVGDEIYQLTCTDKIMNHAFEIAASCVYNTPSAQPEPDIIACGDCKHYICHDRRCGYWNHGVKPLEWCCHGEERDG